MEGLGGRLPYILSSPESLALLGEAGLPGLTRILWGCRPIPCTLLSTLRLLDFKPSSLLSPPHAHSLFACQDGPIFQALILLTLLCQDPQQLP